MTVSLMRTLGSCFTIRSRLLPLLLSALVPALILVHYDVAMGNQSVAAEARATVTGLSQTATDGHHHLIDAAHVTLKLPSTFSGGLLTPPGRASVIKGLSTSQPIFDTPVALHPAGDMISASVPIPVGRNFADRPWPQATLESRHVKMRGVKGVEFFFTSVPVRTNEGDQPRFVALDIPVQQAYAPIQQNIQRILMALTVVAIFTFTIVWISCDKHLEPRLAKLANTTAIVAQDAIGSRTGISNNPDELGQISGGLEKMAAPLQARENDRQRAERYRAELAAIVETSTDAIVSRDSNGIITSWNHSAEQLYGYSREEMIGRARFDHMPEADRAMFKDRLERFAWDERIASFDTSRITKDGQIIQVSMTVSPIFDARGKVVGSVTIARDISGRKLVENKLKALQEINLAVTSTSDLQTILHDLLGQIDKSFPDAISHIRLKNKITGNMEPFACRHIDELAWKAATSRPRRGSIHEVIFETKSPVAVRNMNSDERIAPGGFWKKRGMISYLGVPMIIKDEVIGVLSLLTRKERAFNSEDISFVELIANQAGIAIHNAQLYATSLAQNQALEAGRQERHRLMMAQLRARDEEAKRIAAVIHDESSQLLVAVLLALEDLERRPVARIAEGLKPVKSLLDQFAERLRNLSHELHPAILDQLGLAPSLEILGDQIRQRTGIQVQVDAATNGRLSGALELCIYRVTQEALANIRRHAQAKHVEIQLAENEGWVHCRIQDDGVGFDPKETIAGQSMHGSRGPGLGLALARERIEALRGTLKLQSGPGRGTRLQISIPKEIINVYPATTG